MDSLLTPAAPVFTATAIAFPSGENPTPRVYAAMGAGVSLPITTSPGVNYIDIAKNNSQRWAGQLTTQTVTNPMVTTINGGVSYVNRSIVGNSSRLGLSWDGTSLLVSRTITTALGTRSNNFNVTWVGFSPPQASLKCILNTNGEKALYIPTSGTTAAWITAFGTFNTRTLPFACSDGDWGTFGTLFVVRATGGHQIAYSTNNDGSSWTTIVIDASTTQSSPRIKISNNGLRIFVCFDANNAYSSIDGGATWSAVFALPAGFSHTTLATTPTLDCIGGIKSTDNGTFYYSIDMGATWITVVDGTIGVPFSALGMYD